MLILHQYARHSILYFEETLGVITCLPKFPQVSAQMSSQASFCLSACHILFAINYHCSGNKRKNF